MDIVKEAQWVFDTEIAALQATKASLGEDFETIVRLVVNCTGKVIITGMGKPGHIGTKIAASLASLGTPSFSCTPAKPCMAIWAWWRKRRGHSDELQRRK